MIHGVVQDGTILPTDPIPPDWRDGRQVVIEAVGELSVDGRLEIEKWYAELDALGPAQYEPGEREAIERVMAEADREAKEFVRRSWARFDDVVPSGYKPPERGAQR